MRNQNNESDIDIHNGELNASSIPDASYQSPVGRKNNFNILITNTVIKDSENINYDQEHFGYHIKGGKYYTRERRGKIDFIIELSNFTMKSMFHLVNGTNDSQRLIYIQRYSGEKHFVEVWSSEMKPELFETILKSKRCTFLGSSYNLKQIFSKMMDDESEAEILQVLGWNKEHQIYVFADSIYKEKKGLTFIDELGIIQLPDKRFYLPAFGFSNIHNDDFKTERLYKFSPGKANFEQWTALLYKAYGSNSAIGILFTILAVFRDIVFSEVGFFPFLFLFGDFGTGKTSFTEYILSLFGKDVIGTPLNNATIVALSRLVSSRNNSIFYFKEYTNETDGHAEDFILTAYDGAGRTTGVKTLDSKTKTLPVRSALIFDGNHMPTQKSAILSRMILLNFESSTFSPEETKAFNELKNLSDFGFGNILLELLELRSLFQFQFVEYYKKALLTMRQTLLKYDERTIKHAALLYAVVLQFNQKLKFPFGLEDALQIIKENTSKLNSILKESSVINVFWESFAYGLKRGYLQENIAFKLKKLDQPNINLFNQTILQIKYPNIYPFYVKYCKESSIRFLDMNSLKMIVTSKSNDYFIPSHQKGRYYAYHDKLFGSCYQFRSNIVPGGIEINGVEIQL